MYFDKYANSVEKPVFSKPIPEGVTAESIMNKYFEAIGGKENAMNVKSVHYMANVAIEGVPMQLSADLKRMAPNMESMEMSAQGMGVLVKQKFNGESGYAEQQGMRKDLTAEEIAEKKMANTIVPELNFDMNSVSLDSKTSLNGSDVYKLKVKSEKLNKQVEKIQKLVIL